MLELRSIRQLLILIRKHKNENWEVASFGRITITGDFLKGDMFLQIAKLRGWDTGILKSGKDALVAGNETYCQKVGRLFHITPSLAHGVLIASNLREANMCNLIRFASTAFPFTHKRVAKIRQLRKYILRVLNLKEIQEELSA